MTNGQNEDFLTLLVRVLEGPGGGGAVLPRLRAKVVVEARTSGHRLGVEVGRERAVLQERRFQNEIRISCKLT